MKSIAIAAALSAIAAPAWAKTTQEWERQAQEAFAEAVGIQMRWETCVIDTAVNLGKGNSEPSETIVKVAISKCESSEGSSLRMLEGSWTTYKISKLFADNMQNAYFEKYGRRTNSVIESESKDSVEGFKRRVEAKALEALIMARSAL